jgi:hypothetical protein
MVGLGKFAYSARLSHQLVIPFTLHKVNLYKE